MTRSHPYRFATLVISAMLAAAPAAAQPAPIGVAEPHLHALQRRLDSLAATLPPAERALWDGVLRRAAAAPPSSAEIRVSPILQIGPGGGCDDGARVNGPADRLAIIVEGGRTAGTPGGIIVQGGRTARPAGILVQGGRTAPSGIIVQGGRTAPSGIIVQGGRTGARPGRPASDGPRPGNGAVAIGPKQDDPSRPGGAVAIRPGGDDPDAPRPGTGAVAIGPKQDDPSRPGSAVAIRPGGDDPDAPRPGNGAVAIGPKQDDPSPPPQALGRRLAELAGGLPPEERGALEWLLTRAAQTPSAAPGRPGTPGGIAPESPVTLRQALGIDPLAIGPKQDDPAPPPPAREWILRY